MHHSVVSKATVCIIAGKVDVPIRLLKTEIRGQGRWGKKTRREQSGTG